MALHLGELVLEGGAALAPMAGVADRAFRQICRKFGAVYTVGELTSARGLLQGSRKTEAVERDGAGGAARRGAAFWGRPGGNGQRGRSRPALFPPGY